MADSHTAAVPPLQGHAILSETLRPRRCLVRTRRTRVRSDAESLRGCSAMRTPKARLLQREEAGKLRRCSCWKMRSRSRLLEIARCCCQQETASAQKNLASLIGGHERICVDWDWKVLQLQRQGSVSLLDERQDRQLLHPALAAAAAALREAWMCSTKLACKIASSRRACQSLLMEKSRKRPTWMRMRMRM